MASRIAASNIPVEIWRTIFNPRDRSPSTPRFSNSAMGQMGKSDDDDGSPEGGDDGNERYVEIPEECVQPKKWFRDEPSKEIVKEIREHVAETGRSHTWRGHTHSRPPENAPVKYVGRFELPEKFLRAGKLLVCPVCRPNTAHFGKRDGYIAWFPEEWLVRLIGPDCFATINKEGHAEAVEELKIREKRESEIRFVVSERDQHRLAQKVLDAAKRVAVALDEFGADLCYGLYATLNVNLWPHVRTGELQTTREVEDPRTGKPLFLQERFGSLDGHKLLNPNRKKPEPKFAPHIAFLNEALAVADDTWSERVAQSGTPEIGQLAKKLGDAARDLRAEVVELRGFLSQANLATLRSWGSPNTEGAPISVYARREGPTLKIGSSESRTINVPIPPDLEIDIPSVARLTAKRP
jgi:hypothetical protein